MQVDELAGWMPWLRQGRVDVLERYNPTRTMVTAWWTLAGMAADEVTEDHVVCLSRTLNASPEHVWHALTDQAALAEWFWPPRFDTTVTVDLRVGGGYQVEAGTGEMGVYGEYIEIDPVHRLAMRWRWRGEDTESKVVIDLTGDTDTELRIVHEGLDARAAPMHLQGWSDCLGRLPGYLSSLLRT